MNSLESSVIAQLLLASLAYSMQVLVDIFYLIISELDVDRGLSQLSKQKLPKFFRA